MFGVRAQPSSTSSTARYASLEAIPPTLRARLEQDVLRASLRRRSGADARRSGSDRDPAEIERAERDPKHKMALVFRWYLGMSSRWAIDGDADRRADYQIWCGPAMGAFNAWVAGIVPRRPGEPHGRADRAQPARRRRRRHARPAAAHLRRARPPSAFDFRPRPLA